MFEMSSGSAQCFRNTLLQREKGKIDSVEKKTIRRPQPERIDNDARRPEFKEASQTGFAKALCYELVQQRESMQARVALIMVRREALRKLLEKERHLYAKELSQKGLAIYQQRI